MAPLVRIRTTVMPGGRVEFTAPELVPGQEVEVEVTTAAVEPPKVGIYDFLKSLPIGPRSAESWEEIEREFQEGRDSWAR